MQDLITTGDYGFGDCAEYPEVMDHHITVMTKSGDVKTGYPILKSGDTVPTIDDHYECTDRKKHKSYIDGEHKDIPLFRAVSVNKTLQHMVNGGWYPVSCTPDSMPTGERWDNFATCLYRFHALYCWCEGLSITSKEARDVLLYVFYGTYMWRTKRKKTKIVDRKSKPFLFFLVKKMNNGRSRFVNSIKKISKLSCLTLRNIPNTRSSWKTMELDPLPLITYGRSS